MRVISLSDPPFLCRRNAGYDEKKAGWIGSSAKTKILVEGIERRILRAPESVGKLSVYPPGSRHAHVGSHGVIWWYVFPKECEVEFFDIGHWDSFFD
jgi:hypothetical protein